jgi:hypothetical protein
LSQKIPMGSAFFFSLFFYLVPAALNPWLSVRSPCLLNGIACRLELVNSVYANL